MYENSISVHYKYFLNLFYRIKLFIKGLRSNTFYTGNFQKKVV